VICSDTRLSYLFQNRDKKYLANSWFILLLTATFNEYSERIRDKSCILLTLPSYLVGFTQF
jgi:hypothetical protein